MSAPKHNTADAAAPCPEDDEAAGVIARALNLPGTQGELAARLYTPASADDSGLIVFFPGGGFVADALESGDPFLRILAARTGYRVLASCYTLAQVAPFPAAVEDAHAVLNWAARHRKKLGWNGERLITAGIEAGGNLAAVSALMARDRGGPALAAQLLLMPMLDAGLSSCSMRMISGTPGAERAAGACAHGYRGYLPRAIDRVHPYASPLQSRRMKGLPPALILSADDDPLRDEAEQYGAKLIGAGVKTLVKRLPPIALEDPNARCRCARKESALQEIACFIASLQHITAED
jgi:acetyl esterase/lipase